MDELDIGGKRYISTRRAGREHGYHSDYIGQLIRGGKVKAQKVGRSWYVDEESLSVYLGKEYVSSAAPFSKTSDPVVEPNNMAEKIPLPAEEKTSSEVVEEDIKPKNADDEIPKEISIKNTVSQAPVAEISHNESDSSESSEHQITLTIERKHEGKTDSPGLRYVADTEPLLPDVERSPEIEIVRAHLIPKQETRANKRTSIPVIVGAIALLTVIGSAWAAANLSSTTTVVGDTSSVFYSFSR